MILERNPKLIHNNWLSRGGHEGELVCINCCVDFSRMVKIISGGYSNFFNELLWYIPYHNNSFSKERGGDLVCMEGGG
jgi:hypothetical protein